MQQESGSAPWSYPWGRGCEMEEEAGEHTDHCWLNVRNKKLQVKPGEPGAEQRRSSLEWAVALRGAPQQDTSMLDTKAWFGEIKCRRFVDWNWGRGVVVRGVDVGTRQDNVYVRAVVGANASGPQGGLSIR